MPIIEWTDELSVKISIFDNEHKKLIAIINKLYDAMSQGQGNKLMNDIIIELHDYTKTHFKHEEEIMQKYDYPNFAEQKRSHDEFVAKLAETQEKYQKGTLVLSVPVLTFLKSWVQNHIMKMDRGYSEFLIGKGVK